MNKVGDVLAALSAAVVCYAVIHEWSYFETVGSNFLRLMTLSDYIASVLSSLPGTVLSFVIGMWSSMVNRPAPGNEDNGACEKQEIRKSWEMSWWTIGAAFSFVALVSLIEPSWFLLMIPLILLYGRLLNPTLRALAARGLDSLMPLALTLPLLVIFAWTTGKFEASVDTRRRYEIYELTIAGQKPVEITIIRGLGAGLVFLDHRSTKVTYIPFEKVEEIRSKDSLEPHRYICEWTDYLCK